MPKLSPDARTSYIPASCPRHQHTSHLLHRHSSPLHHPFRPRPRAPPPPPPAPPAPPRHTPPAPSPPRHTPPLSRTESPPPESPCLTASPAHTGFLLFTSSLDSPASIGPALGMLGGGVQQAQKTSSKAQSQVGGAVEKIDTARPSTRARARPRWSERLSETARGRARLGDRRPERAAVRRRRGARAGPSHARRGAGGGRGVRWRRARP